MKMLNACDVIFNIIFTCKIYQDDEPGLRVDYCARQSLAPGMKMSWKGRTQGLKRGVL